MERAPDGGRRSASPRRVKRAGMRAVPGALRAGLPPTPRSCPGSPGCALCPGRCARGTLPRPPRQDLAVLQDKLRISNKKLEEYETLFKCQEETTQKLVLEYQARLEEGEERLRRQQEDKDIQMKGIISR